MLGKQETVWEFRRKKLLECKTFRHLVASTVEARNSAAVGLIGGIYVDKPQVLFFWLFDF